MLRIPGLGFLPFWADEGDAVFTALKGIYVFHPPAFPILTYLWLPLGRTDASLRLLPALLGVLGVLAMWRLAFRVGGVGLARMASLLFAFSPAGVHFARELHPYSLLMLVGLLSWDCLLALLEKGGGLRLLAYGASAALALYTHHYAFFLLGGQALACLWFRPRLRAVARLAAAFVVALVLYLPYVPTFYYSMSRLTINFWAWKVTLQTPYMILRLLLACYHPPRLLAFLLVALVLGLALIGVAWKRDARYSRLLLASGVLLPILAAILTSLALPSSILVERYLTFVLGPLLLLTALGLRIISSRWLRWAGLTILILLQVQALGYVYRDEIVTQDFQGVRRRKEVRQAYRYVAEHFKAGDVVGTTCLSGAHPYFYYLEYRRGLGPGYLLDLDGIYRSHFHHIYHLDETVGLYPYCDPIDVEQVVPRFRRLWLVGTQWVNDMDASDFDSQHRQRIFQYLVARYPTLSSQHFYGVDLTLFDLTERSYGAPS